MADDMTTVLDGARRVILEDPAHYQAALQTLPEFARLSDAEQRALLAAPAEQIAQYLATSQARIRNSARAAQVA
jgi:hypothetical protein